MNDIQVYSLFASVLFANVNASLGIYFLGVLDNFLRGVCKRASVYIQPVNKNVVFRGFLSF